MTGLHSAATAAGLKFGFQWSGSGLLSKTQATDIVKNEGLIVTEGDKQQMRKLQPSEGVFTYAEADVLIDFAEANSLAVVHGGHLVWENEPAWVTAITDPVALRGVMETHIETVLTRYGSRISQWNVVNETHSPFGEAADAWRPNHWYANLGTSYIEWAFKAAQDAAAPGVELIWNLAWSEWDSAAALMRPKVLEHLDTLLAAGCRIDGLGLQCHLRADQQSSGEAVADFANEVAERGLDIYITELDVIDKYITTGDVRQQCADLVRTMIGPICRDVPALKHVLAWAPSDDTSWLRTFYPRDDLVPTYGGNPYNDEYLPNPMYQALFDVFAMRPQVASTASLYQTPTSVATLTTRGTSQLLLDHNGRVLGDVSPIEDQDASFITDEDGQSIDADLLDPITDDPAVNVESLATFSVIAPTARLLLITPED